MKSAKTIERPMRAREDPKEQQINQPHSHLPQSSNKTQSNNAYPISLIIGTSLTLPLVTSPATPIPMTRVVIKFPHMPAGDGGISATMMEPFGAVSLGERGMEDERRWELEKRRGHAVPGCLTLIDDDRPTLFFLFSKTYLNVHVPYHFQNNKHTPMSISRANLWRLFILHLDELDRVSRTNNLGRSGTVSWRPEQDIRHEVLWDTEAL